MVRCRALSWRPAHSVENDQQIEVGFSVLTGGTVQIIDVVGVRSGIETVLSTSGFALALQITLRA